MPGQQDKLTSQYLVNSGMQLHTYARLVKQENINDGASVDLSASPGKECEVYTFKELERMEYIMSEAGENPCQITRFNKDGETVNSYICDYYGQLEVS